MTGEELDACFNGFTASAFRLETFQHYTSPGEQARLNAFRHGMPRPERSVRTSPWLARIAVTTAAGKQWSRCRIVKHPLTEYTRYELVGYVESQAAGEAIYIAAQEAHKALTKLTRDFWLFDAGTPGAFAVLMDYDSDGTFTGATRTSDTGVVMRCQAERDLALRLAVPLNKYLISDEKAGKAA